MAFNLADMVNNRKPVETENISDTVYRDVFELEPSKDNFYSTDPERLQGLKNSILLFGVMQDVLIEDVDGKDRIISGHCRTMCCRMLVEEGHEEFRKINCKYTKVSLNTEKFPEDKAGKVEQLINKLGIIQANRFREKSDWEKMQEALITEEVIKELRDLTSYDELELDTLGDEKTALFLIMSDTDGTFNFLISMIYTQMFNLLCEKADDVYGGRLPVHVRCLIDEAANIGQIPNLEKLVATIRSREISACLVLQAKSQLKAIYKDNADTIIGNMDSQIFLGGTEQTTLKDLNAILGKETIDMYNTGQSKGSQESYNMNYQKLGKDLMTMDELAVMDGSKCIVQVRGVRPFLSDKYDLTQHPNYKLTADYDKRNYFDVVKFLSHNLILKADDEYQVIDLTE